MNEQTQAKLVDMLEVLGQKLGATGEQLWSALLMQAPLWAGTKLFAYFVIGALLVYIAWRLSNVEGGLTVKNYRDDVVLSTKGACLIGVAVVTFLYFLAFFAQLPFILAGFFNPAYWALKVVLGVSSNV